MKRVVRSSLLVLSAASLFLASPAAEAGNLNDQWCASDFRSDSSDFFSHSSFSLSDVGPAWFRNAMPGSRRSFLRAPSVYDREADSTDSFYRYANDIGGLANPFSVMSLTSGSTFVST